MIAAAVQMCSGDDVEKNLATAERLARRARERGAELIVLPENFALMAASDEAKFAVAERIDFEGLRAPHPSVGPQASASGPILRRLGALAKELGAFIVGGGMPERGPDERHVHNTNVVFDPSGELYVRYRKVHLFDVAIPDGASYHESATVAPGDRPVTADLPWFTLGLSVCYDLRFPELYRALIDQGARVVVVPAAFTLHTGKDHWHVLLRARAIDNQVFVIAAAQQGRHPGNRTTYGHSLIVNPWGTVIAEADDGEGLAVAEIDLAVQERVRREVPCLKHRRL